MSEEKNKIEILVISQPTYVSFECPHCEKDIVQDYDFFGIKMGKEPQDWEHSKFDCPKCQKELEIKYIDWE